MSPPGPAGERRLSPWEPLATPAYRSLWLVWLSANVCMWMTNITSAWMMTTLTTSTVMVALVQSATGLPLFLFGLPSGALADMIDRRSLLLATMIWVALNAVLLWLATASGHMTPMMLLVLTFSYGFGLTLRMPVYAAIIPDLVARPQLPAAMALNGMAMNASRIIGPIVGGAILATAGTAWVFLVNALVSVVAALLVMRWKPPRVERKLPNERFFSAIRIGVRYVRSSPGMRAVMVRSSFTNFQTGALLGLLPLVAKQQPDGDAGTYTLLLSSLGVGAIFVGTLLPRLRRRFRVDRLVELGTIALSIAMVMAALSNHVFVAAAGMAISGMAWLGCANTLVVAAQFSLPNWVRARGMSMYQMTVMGGQAVGAAVWGQVAGMTSVSTSLLAASAFAVFILLFTRRLTLEHDTEAGLQPAKLGMEPAPAFPIKPDEGPVVVTIEYLIDPVRAGEFRAVMQESRLARLRYGARSWELLHDTAKPERYLETFVADTWADHLRRYDRFTATDVALRERRRKFHIGTEPPRVTTYIGDSLH